MKVIFLDFDGVLNSYAYLYNDPKHDENIGEAGALEPAAVERLNRIVRATGAEVVISSSWRYGRSRVRLSEMLRARGFEGVVRGCTPDYVQCCEREGGRVYGEPRGHEIREWLKTWGEALGVESYVVLDDNSDMDGVRERFVQTNPQTGLTDADVERVIEMLGRVAA